ncbi:MAG: hypothetical protein NVS3B10_09930 [Polyangiales bacterium]
MLASVGPTGTAEALASAAVVIGTTLGAALVEGAAPISALAFLRHAPTSGATESATATSSGVWQRVARRAAIGAWFSNTLQRGASFRLRRTRP